LRCILLFFTYYISVYENFARPSIASLCVSVGTKENQRTCSHDLCVFPKSPDIVAMLFRARQIHESRSQCRRRARKPNRMILWKSLLCPELLKVNVFTYMSARAEFERRASIKPSSTRLSSPSPHNHHSIVFFQKKKSNADRIWLRAWCASKLELCTHMF
jgi:hypothetical protein